PEHDLMQSKHGKQAQDRLSAICQIQPGNRMSAAVSGKGMDRTAGQIDEHHQDEDSKRKGAQRSHAQPHRGATRISNCPARPAARCTPIAATSGDVAMRAKAADDGYSTSAATSHMSPTVPITSDMMSPENTMRPPSRT